MKGILAMAQSASMAARRAAIEQRRPEFFTIFEWWLHDAGLSQGG